MTNREIYTFDELAQQLYKFNLIDNFVGTSKTYLNQVAMAVDCKIVSVSDVRQTFDAFLSIHCHYKLTPAVERDAFDVVGPDPDAIDFFSIVDNFPFFVPKIALSNCVDARFDTFEKTVRVNRHTGDIWVLYENFCTIFEDLELQKFPYDRQLFRIYIHTLGVSAIPWFLTIKASDYPPFKIPIPDNTTLLRFQAKNWIVKGKKVDVKDLLSLLRRYEREVPTEALEKIKKKNFNVKVTYVADRDQRYYQSNYILVSAFLVFGTSSVFLIPADSVEERQNLIITILLAMVALKFAISATTPVIGYSTYLDKFILAWNTTLFLVLVWNFGAAARVSNACNNDLSDEDCVTEAVLGIHQTEQKLVVVFFVAWFFVLILMLSVGWFKDDYQTTVSKQTENQRKESNETIITMSSSEDGKERTKSNLDEGYEDIDH